MAQWTFQDLCDSKPQVLEELVAGGKAPKLDQLRGWEYRGFNILPPYGVPLFWALANIRFIKCFGDGEEVIRGVNLKVARGSRTAPWTCTPSDNKPERIGYYNVYPPGEHPRAKRYPNAIFFDYRQPENNLFSGSNLDDFAVCANHDDPSLLVARAELDLGVMRFHSYFVVERLQPLRNPI